MNDDQFTKLFKYIEGFRTEVTEEFADVKEEIRALRDSPDTIGSRLDDAEVEQAARDPQFARLIEWAKEVSKKTGVPLPDF